VSTPAAGSQPRLLPELRREPFLLPRLPPSASADPPPQRFFGPGPPNVRQVPTVLVFGRRLDLAEHTPTGTTRLGPSRPLEPAIREALAAAGTQTLFVRADQSVPLEKVREVFATARAAGATSFAAEAFPMRVDLRERVGASGAADAPAPVRMKRYDPVVTVTSSGGLLVGRRGHARDPRAATAVGAARWLGHRARSAAISSERRERRWTSSPSSSAPGRGTSPFLADRDTVAMMMGNRPGAEPPAVSRPTTRRPQSPVLTITREGKLFLGTSEIDFADLEEELRRALQATGPRRCSSAGTRAS
jgi:biopolymer transport protein ExbD